MFYFLLKQIWNILSVEIKLGKNGIYVFACIQTFLYIFFRYLAEYVSIYLATPNNFKSLCLTEFLEKQLIQYFPY